MSHEIGHTIGLRHTDSDTTDANGNHGLMDSDAGDILATTTTAGFEVDDFGENAPNVPFFTGIQDSIGAVYNNLYGGSTTIGLYDPDVQKWFLRNQNTLGFADMTFSSTDTGIGSDWIPVTGDWNADFNDTIGHWDPVGREYYLKDENTGGSADNHFRYGPLTADWLPLTGDWNRDGTDSIGLYDQGDGRFYLRNSNTAGVADVTPFDVGPNNNNWLPLAGDWDGDGIEEVGLFDPVASKFFLKNELTSGFADTNFIFGPANGGWMPITGDWDGDGIDTIGLYEPAAGKLHLRNSNSAGTADLIFRYGPTNENWLPIAGDWDFGIDPGSGSSSATGGGGNSGGSSAFSAPSTPALAQATPVNPFAQRSFDNGPAFAAVDAASQNLVAAPGVDGAIVSTGSSSPETTNKSSADIAVTAHDELSQEEPAWLGALAEDLNLSLSQDLINA